MTAEERCSPGVQSEEKYLFVLLRTCCAFSSGGMMVWCTTCGRYIASTGGILCQVSVELRKSLACHSRSGGEKHVARLKTVG